MKKIQLLALFLTLNVAVFSQAYFQHHKKGETAYNQGNYSEAIGFLTQVIEVKPEFDKSLSLRGLSYEKTKEYDKAIADFLVATTVKPKMAAYHAGLGRNYYLKGDFEKAIAAFTVALERDKKLMEVYSDKLYAHIKLNQYPLAVETGKAAILKLKSGKTYYDLGVAQDSLMKYEDAVYSFSRAKFYEPKMMEAYIGLAFSQMKMEE